MKAILACAVLCLLMGCTAKPSYVKTELTWDKDIRPIIEVNCFDCHGRTKTEGEVNLMSNEVVKDKLWTIYKVVVQKQSMPPENKLGIELSQGDRLLINSWIRGNAPGISTGQPY